jgi:DNA-binding NarL/FixJ family response regulator
MVSAYESEDYRREAASAGAAGYIIKDTNIDQLHEAVRKALGQSGEG